MGKQTKVLVTGITGQQGGAVARTLIEQGFKVTGLTRNPDSAAASAVQAWGARLVKGDYRDPASLREAFADQDAVFAVSTFFEQGIDAEVDQGYALAMAAREARVGHFVFTSVVGAERHTGIPHFDSKGKIEERIHELDLPYTIIRPVFFMENLYFPQTASAVRQGVYAQALPGDRKLQQVAVEDIGRFGALVIANRDRFLRRAIDIASDEVNGSSVAGFLSNWLRSPVKYEEVPLEALRAMSEEMAAMFAWFDQVGYDVDIQDLKRRYPEVGWQRYGEWLAERDPGELTPQQADSTENSSWETHPRP